jgi:hypothetical protein
MKSQLLFLLLILSSGLAFGQKKIRGEVRDTAGQPVVGANVYLLNTYDGTSTDEKGYFEFETALTDDQELAVSAIGYVSWQIIINLNEIPGSFWIQLKEETRRLDDLVITAGLFEASDEKKSVALRPLDIVTTAGATADIPGVLNTLPGTQTVGEQGRLFVRGGESEETRNFIDGMLVEQAYGLSPENIPTRMRFSPFLFSGTSFSTGGYSAEYGQALSGTLILKTDNDPVQTQTDLSLMSVGGSIAHTQKWDRRSIFMETAYSDLTPYFYLIPQNTNWEQAPRSWQNTLMYRDRLTENGMLRVFYTNDLSSLSLDQPSWLDVSQYVPVQMKNVYHHANANYEDFIKKNWRIYGGLSATYSGNDSNMDRLKEVEDYTAVHTKTYVQYDKGGKAGLKIGMDHYWFSYHRDLEESVENGKLTNTFREWLPGLFIETDLYFTEKLVGRIGMRAEYTDLADQITLSPRLSFAYKTGKFSQISLATGIFRQRPAMEYRGIQSGLNDELATHYILNYQWIKGLRTFRIECYLKEYKNLVTFNGSDHVQPVYYTNEGFGYARGLDVFWRDSETFRNVDYWISYSFLDTERLYRDYPEESTPSFASRHNLSIVYKHFITPIRSQVGATLTWASSRPYHDPNTGLFNSGKTPAYFDLSFNYSYLIKTNLILHFSATNVFGLDHIYGYQYSLVPDSDGHYEGMPVRQPARRFIFLGLFWTISKDREANQLRNL